MRLTLLSLIFTCFSLYSFSQTSTKSSISEKTDLTGKVVDSITGFPIEFASVRLLLDSSIIDGALTDSIGDFVINGLKKGKYFIKVSSIGYTTKAIPTFGLPPGVPSFRIGTISLVPSIQNLDEIKIVAELDVLKAGIDKKIYDVGQDINTQGTTASEILNNVPSIEVDQEGNISLRGDGNVIILIDGRPSTLTLNNGLSGLPANSIERVEVVTNPSAKYDPDGTSGIINIVLKKSKLRGMNGSITATVATGWLVNGSASFNVRTGKFNLFGSYSNRYSTGYRDFYSSLETSSALGTTLLEQERPGDMLRKNQNLRIGLDYFLTDKQTIGFSVTGSKGLHDRFGKSFNRFYDINGLQYSENIRSSSDDSEDENLDVNINYAAELKKKGKISAFVTSSFEDEFKTSDYLSEFVMDNYLASNKKNLNQRLENKENNRVSTTQLDYEKIFPNLNARIETGVKAILRNEERDSYSETLDTTSQLFEADTLANFRYDYTEQVYSVYGIWGQQINKWKYQVGVRGEYAKQVPNLIDEGVKITSEYFNLFPSGHLRYELTKKQELNLSYSRRINRPRSRTLNPFVNYSDPLNLRFGNPYLTPEYINSFDVGHSFDSKKINLTTSVYYRFTTDVIQRFKTFYDSSSTGTSWGNIDESQSYGVEMVVVYKPKKWWRNTVSINGNQVQYNNTEGESNFSNTGINFNLKYAGTINFWKRTAQFQVNIRYNTPRITPQGKVLPRSVMDISASKKLNDHWTISTRLSDVFDTQGFKYDLAQDNVRQLGEYKWRTRRIHLTVTYRFGKLEVTKNQRSPSGGGGGMDF